MRLLLALLFTSFSSFAVTNSSSVETYKAIISLSSYKNGICTGTVVGLNPPTVITARHCVEMRAFQFEGYAPETILTEDFDGQYFSTTQAYLPGDLAVLIFSFSSEEKFRKKMSEKDLFQISFPRLDSWQKVKFCGYGGTSTNMKEIGKMGTQLCSENYLLKEDSSESFNRVAENVFVASKVSKFSDLQSYQKSKYVYALVQSFIWAYGKGTRYGLGALAPEPQSKYGSFDDRSSLIREGDSGGPLFIKDESGRNVLIGVTSGNLKREELLIGAFFWRLDHPWSRALLKNAFNQGADIKF